MIVVTGAAGFIGSNMVRSLNEQGHTDLLLVDHLESIDKWKNLRTKTYGSIVSPEQFLVQLESGAIRPGAIIHIGAITDTSEKDADALYRQNTAYTRTLATWSMKHGARFIYASSASVYGDGEHGFSDSDDLTPQLVPMNPYAWSKWLFDAQALREGWSNEIVGLRFFNVFGPNEYHKARMASVVWHATNQVKSTGKIQLFQSHKAGYGDGEQSRDFVYVGDVCNVILWFLENPRANGVFNLGSGKARPFNALAHAVFEALGKEPSIDYVPTPENIRDAYQYFTEADLSKLRAAGYTSPMTTLEEGVTTYVRGYLMKPYPYR